MNYAEKLKLIISEYALRPDNHHCLTGTGGNLDNYLFIADKEIVSDSNVESIKISENKLICNPKFIIDSSSKEVRDKLDSVIADAIAETKFVAPIRLVDGKFITDVDMEKDSTARRIILAQRKCAEFREALEAGTLTDEHYSDLVNHLNSIELPIALFAFRVQVGLERIVHHSLDEHKILGSWMQKVNKHMDSL